MKSSSYILQLVLAVMFLTETHAQQKLSLANALRLAAANNLELQQNALEVERTSHDKVIARSLFLPSVYAVAQANHYFKLPVFFGFGDNVESGAIPYGRFGGEDHLAAFVTVTQPLYNPFALPGYHAALLKQERALQNSREREVSVLAEVKDTYLRILVLQKRIELTKESINRNTKVLQDSRLLFLQGKGLRVDTLRAYTSVKNLEPDLVRLTFAVETGKLQLRTLLGVDSLQDFVLTDSLSIPVSEQSPTEDALYELVLSNNPEFQALKVRAELEKQNVRIATAYRRPSLSLVGQYQVQSQTRSFEYGNARYPTSSFVGVQLAVPVFTGLGAQARIKKAAIVSKQTDLEVNHAREKLKARVHHAVANHREAFLRLANTSIVQETAQLSYNIIQYRYKNGISPRLELTDAELALSTAQSNYLEAVYDYLSAGIEIRKLTGTGEAR
jgi:outer membrane protein TolC